MGNNIDEIDSTAMNEDSDSRNELLGQSNTVTGQHKYISPVGDKEFPVLASTALYYKELTRNMYDFTLNFDKVRKCGFNVIDAFMTFGDDNNYINRRAEDAGLAIEAGDTWYFKPDEDGGNTFQRLENYVKACGGLSAVKAWKFRDEPTVEDFDSLKLAYDLLYELSDQIGDRMVITNLLGGYMDSTLRGLNEGKTIGETYYARDYVDRFEEMFKPGIWTYDYYPIGENAWGIDMFHHAYQGFYGNLIFYACRTYAHQINGVTYEGRPFWAYVESMSEKKTNADNVLAPKFPKARESYMRYEAFAALAFGAQGILYWTYGDREPNGNEVYLGALLDMEGNPTEAWYAAQKVNMEIHALKDVFLGCKLLQFWFSTNNDTVAGFNNGNAVKFLYGGHVQNAQDTSTIYVNDDKGTPDFKGLGIVTTKIMKTIRHADETEETKYYKIFLNQDFRNPTHVRFTINSAGIYSIFPDVELAAKKFESKENMKIEVKPVRIPVQQWQPLELDLPGGGYAIFEVPQ